VTELHRGQAARVGSVRQEEGGNSPAGGATIAGGASAFLLRLASVPRSGALGSSRAPGRPSGALQLPAHAASEAVLRAPCSSRRRVGSRLFA
jgi:hypothetical protein